MRDSNGVADQKYVGLVVANNDIVLNCIVFLPITPGFSRRARTVQDGGEKEGALLPLLPFFLSHRLGWQA